MGVSRAAPRGLCVGHVGPEAADAGPIGLLKDGDIITIDAETGELVGWRCPMLSWPTARNPSSPRRLRSRPARWRALPRMWDRPRYGAVTTPGADQEVRCYADI